MLFEAYVAMQTYGPNADSLTLSWGKECIILNQKKLRVAELQGGVGILSKSSSISPHETRKRAGEGSL